MKFSECVEIVGSKPSRYQGIKQYVSTGALDSDHIDENSIEEYAYDDRPSRADLVAEAGNVLFAKMAETKKTLVINNQNEKYLFSTGFFAVKPKKNVLTTECLYYLLNSNTFLSQKDKYSSGATQKAISNASLEKIIVNIPCFSKQEDIVKQLDKLSNIIKKTRKQLLNFDLLIKSRFIEMFGDPVTNDKDWNTQTVEACCDTIYGGGTPSKSHAEYYLGKIPWVSSKDMKNDYILDSQDHITEDAVKNSTAKMVPVNSVIMVIRSGILKHTLPVAVNKVPITVNQDLKVFIPKKDINPVFFARQFKMLEKDILSGVRAVTADNIEFNSLKNRTIPVPPLELQQQFATFVQQIDKSKFENNIMEVAA